MRKLTTENFQNIW